MKDAKEMTNDEIFQEIESLNLRLKELKSNIKPIPAVKEVPLHELNSVLRQQRKEKFDRQNQITEALKKATGVNVDAKAKKTATTKKMGSKA